MLVYKDEDSKTLYWQVGSYVYAEATLPKDARVLDVGSGQDPHPGSNVILDKYLFDNTHRMAGFDFCPPQFVNSNGEDVSNIVSIVGGDIEHLPFPDKSFDFIIANNVLEHIENIEGAFKELSRVGKSGFIDVPTLQSEWLFPQGEIHKWTFDHDGEYFVAHSLANFSTPFGKTMHEVFANNKEIQQAWSKSRHYFHCVRFWQGEVKIRIGAPIHG